jgi:hypothetical protein
VLLAPRVEEFEIVEEFVEAVIIEFVVTAFVVVELEVVTELVVDVDGVSRVSCEGWSGICWIEFELFVISSTGLRSLRAELCDEVLEDDVEE